MKRVSFLCTKNSFSFCVSFSATAELNKKFLGRLEVETICMKAFMSGCTISTFHTELLDLQAIEEIEREFHMEKEKEKKDTCSTGFSDDHGESKSGCKLLEPPFTLLESAALENIREPISPLSVMDRARSRATTKASACGSRTLNRNQCLALLETLKNAKPTTLNRDDPQDIFAIENSRRSTLGTYRLKNSLYSPNSTSNQPKLLLNMQQQYSEKCLKILSLIQNIHYSKMAFNEK